MPASIKGGKECFVKGSPSDFSGHPSIRVVMSTNRQDNRGSVATLPSSGMSTFQEPPWRLLKLHIIDQRVPMAIDWPNLLKIILPPSIAIIVTQIVAQAFVAMRKPRVEMFLEGRRQDTWHWSDNKWVVPVSRESKKNMWRLLVQQKEISPLFSWLLRSREAALQCKAELEFYDKEGERIFVMPGRWANSPEISLISSTDQLEKFYYPEKIDVSYHSSEPLDCIVHFLGDDVAFGWNNVAYHVDYSDGRIIKYKLVPGRYDVHVKVSGLNFVETIKKFRIEVSKDCNDTKVWFSHYLQTHGYHHR